MATAGQLKREINNLRSQLNDVNRQYDNLSRQLREQNNRDIERMHQQFNEALARQKQISDAEYARMFEEFQNRLLEVQKQKTQELREQTKQLVEQQRGYTRQIEELNRQIEKEFNELKKSEAQREDFTRQYAYEVYRQAMEARKTADEQPHGFFLPNQFDVIAEQEQKITDEIEKGLLQSAVADANSVSMQYEILTVKTKSSFDDWLVAFEEFSETVRGLRARIDAFLSHGINGDAIAPEECNFWSRGKFRELNEELRGAEEMLAAADRMGIVNYLKSITNPDRSLIHSSLIQAKIWQTRLSAILNCIVSERCFSHQRFDVGEEAAQLLEDEMYVVLKNSFVPPVAETASADWYIAGENEDPFEKYGISATLNGLDTVNLHLIPVRVDGIAVRTECHIFVELQSIQSAAHEESSLAAFQRMLSVISEKHRISPIAYRYLSDNAVRPYGKDAAEAVARLENAAIQKADPDRQIQLTERKYIK